MKGLENDTEGGVQETDDPILNVRKRLSSTKRQISRLHLIHMNKYIENK